MNIEQTLKKGTELHSLSHTYRIEQVLGQGSFGVTYLATGKFEVGGTLSAMMVDVKVAVKEFFIKEMNTRDASGSVKEASQGEVSKHYSMKFRSEAENLSHIKHENIVKVLDFFEANNTEYYVMEYIEGTSLENYISQCGHLTEVEALNDFRIIAEALRCMHNNQMLHLDLKPGNIMRCANDGRLLLIDFGLSKQYSTENKALSSTTIGAGTPGYMPIEQAFTHEGKDFAPTLDIYALGATLFKMLTGKTPPDASEINNDGLPKDTLLSYGVSEDTISLIEKCMNPRKKNRPQSIKDVFALLDGNVEITEKPDNVAVIIEHTSETKDVNDETQYKNNETNVHQLTNKKEDKDFNNEKEKEPIKKRANKKRKTFLIAVAITLLLCLLGILSLNKSLNTKENTVSISFLSNGNLHCIVNGVEFNMIQVKGCDTLQDYDVYISQTEVTQKLWKAVMGGNPYLFTGLDQPAVEVNWNDDKIFIIRLESITKGYFDFISLSYDGYEWGYSTSNNCFVSSRIATPPNDFYYGMGLRLAIKLKKATRNNEEYEKE